MKQKSANLKQSALNAFERASRFRLIAFIVVIGAIYGYLLYSINTLGAAQPTDEKISSEVTAIRIPKVDQAVVKQLEDLRDNSVSVNSLFEDARNNPFQE